MVALSYVRYFFDTCVFAIWQSDSLTVRELIQTYDATVRVVTIYTARISAIIKQVTTKLCPGQPIACSRHGSCVLGRCVCDTGQDSCELTCVRRQLVRTTSTSSPVVKGVRWVRLNSRPVSLDHERCIEITKDVTTSCDLRARIA